MTEEKLKVGRITVELSNTAKAMFPDGAMAGSRRDMDMTVLGNQAPSGGEPDASTGQLVKQLSEQISELVRDEVRLATLEMTGKAKTAARSAGLFGGGGVMADVEQIKESAYR